MNKVFVPLICINPLIFFYSIAFYEVYYFSKIQERIVSIFLLLVLLISLGMHIYFFKKHKRELAQKLNIAQAQLAANVAHEIRNPLVALKGFLQLEQKKSHSTLGKENITLLLEEIKQIEETIEGFIEESNKD